MHSDADRSSDIDRDRARFHFLLNAPGLFNAVVTAVEVGVFTHVAARPGTDVAGIREAVGLPSHQLRVLLQAVCATGLLTRRDGGYHLSAVAAEELLDDGPGSWLPILVGWREIYYPAFAQLTTALRSGTNTALAGYDGDEPTLYGRLSHHPEAERVLHASMSAFTHRVNGPLLAAPLFDGIGRLLDVGGGDGTTASSLVRAHPRMKVTVFDLPSVTRIGRDRAGPSQETGVEFHPGDLFADDYPTGFDAVLFSHVLEIFDETRIRTLLAKAYAALPVGGRIVLYHSHVSDDETDGVFSARLSLYLTALATGRGMSYPVASYVRWLTEVGCTKVDVTADLPYEHALLVATKA